jgi:hypothetical protein
VQGGSPEGPAAARAPASLPGRAGTADRPPAPGHYHFENKGRHDMADISIEAAVAVVQEASYRRAHPVRQETEAELAARGCALHTSMRAGSVILRSGRNLGDDGKFMTNEQRPVLILSEGRPDTASDPFGRALTAYQARDLISGHEGTLTFGARGVVSTRAELPYRPLAETDPDELLARLADGLAEITGADHDTAAQQAGEAIRALGP